jgi:hypothetical protein
MFLSCYISFYPSFVFVSVELNRGFFGFLNHMSRICTFPRFLVFLTPHLTCLYISTLLVSYTTCHVFVHYHVFWCSLHHMSRVCTFPHCFGFLHQMSSVCTFPHCFGFLHQMSSVCTFPHFWFLTPRVTCVYISTFHSNQQHCFLQHKTNYQLIQWPPVYRETEKAPESDTASWSGLIAYKICEEQSPLINVLVRVQTLLAVWDSS